MERIEQHYAPIGTMEKIYGDIFVLTNPPKDDDGDDTQT